MTTKTFLFVDQVGSTEQLTRLGDHGAQQVRRALFDTLRQATEVAGGHEVDFTGDGLFCAFDGAAEGVEAAVAMQQLVWSFNGRRPDDQRLAVRIGLNTGEPLESEGGGYFGAAVVVAARLCSVAVPGQVLVSQLVRALVEPCGVQRFEPVGQLALKGVPEPMETFSVAWTPDERRASLPPLLAAARATEFVGRRRELQAVTEAWERIAEGGRGLVLVSGDQGMGVTRFAAEAAHLLRERGASVWAGAGQGAESRLPMGGGPGHLGGRHPPGGAAAGAGGSRARPVAAPARPRRSGAAAPRTWHRWRPTPSCSSSPTPSTSWSPGGARSSRWSWCSTDSTTPTPERSPFSGGCCPPGAAAGSCSWRATSPRRSVRHGCWRPCRTPLRCSTSGSVGCPRPTSGNWSRW